MANLQVRHGLNKEIPEHKNKAVTYPHDVVWCKHGYRRVLTTANFNKIKH